MRLFSGEHLADKFRQIRDSESPKGEGSVGASPVDAGGPPCGGAPEGGRCKDVRGGEVPAPRGLRRRWRRRRRRGRLGELEVDRRRGLRLEYETALGCADLVP